MTNALRPYYNAETFQSPVKGHQRLTVVHGGNNSSAGSELVATSASHRSDQSNFVYLDLEMGGDSIQAIGSTILRLYSRVLVSQPFEVAKVLLQVGNWEACPSTPSESSTSSSNLPTPSSTNSYLDHLDNDSDEDSESSDEELAFFSSNAERSEGAGSGPGEGGRERESQSRLTRRVRRPRKNPSTSRTEKDYVNAIAPATQQLLDVVAVLQQTDGLKGLWRGVHTTFVLGAAASMIESWVSGFISAVAALPDPHIVPILHSPSPLASLSAAVLAAVSSAVILLPFDAIKIRFFTTTFATKPRSFRTCVSRLTSFRSPSTILIPSVLNTGLSSLIQLATPYVLYTRLGIDRFSAPSLYNIGMLLSSLFTITIKLPLETMMRRAQVNELQNSGMKPASFIIRPKPYTGVAQTLWDVIVGKEPIQNLYKGWRLSTTAAVAEWGVTAIQQSDNRPEHF